MNIIKKIALFSILSLSNPILLAIPITLEIVINPIQICDNAGTTCANSGLELYEAEMDKIYAQAGIDIVFQSFKQYNDTSALILDAGPPISGSEAEIFLGSGRPLADPTPSVVNMWFAQSLPFSGSLFGLGLVGGDGIIISDLVFGANRIDTLAHELGHNLGLSHHGPNDHLIDSGSSRLSPADISNITSNGIDGLSILSAADIATILSSPFVVARDIPSTSVPAPASIYLLCIGLFAFRFYSKKGLLK